MDSRAISAEPDGISHRRPILSNTKRRRSPSTSSSKSSQSAAPTETRKSRKRREKREDDKASNSQISHHPCADSDDEHNSHFEDVCFDDDEDHEETIDTPSSDTAEREGLVASSDSASAKSNYALHEQTMATVKAATPDAAKSAESTYFVDAAPRSANAHAAPTTPQSEEVTQQSASYPTTIIYPSTRKTKKRISSLIHKTRMRVWDGAFPQPAQMNLVLEAMDETEAFLNTKGLDEQDWADQLKATQDFVRSVENGTNDDLKAPEEMEEEEEREEVEVDTIDVEVSNQDQRDSKSIYKLARTSGSVSMGLPDDDGEKEEQTEGRDGSEVDEAIARSVGDDRPGIATTLGVELGQRLMFGKENPAVTPAPTINSAPTVTPAPNLPSSSPPSAPS